MALVGNGAELEADEVLLLKLRGMGESSGDDQGPAPWSSVWDRQSPTWRRGRICGRGPRLWVLWPRGSDERLRGAANGRAAEARGSGTMGSWGWRTPRPIGGWMGVRAQDSQH